MNSVTWKTAAASLLVALATPATALTVQSTDSVYNYSGAQVAGMGSTTPQVVTLAAGTNRVLYFTASGSVSLTPGADPYGFHGPDGGPQSFDMNVSAAAGLSGVHSNNVGYLAGAFLNGSEPGNPTPATSDFTSAGTGENFTALSPGLDQVFFIGDGVTSAGTQQSFYVPNGATKLVLGIVDAGNYNGPPGAYFDNAGSYTVNISTPGVPETASWAMFIGGFGLVGSVLRRRRPVMAVNRRGILTPDRRPRLTPLF